MDKVLLTLSAIVILLSHSVSAQQPTITVNAGASKRDQSLVEVTFRNPLNSSASYKVINPATGKSAETQHLAGNKLVFVLPDLLKPNEVAKYLLIKESRPKKKKNPIEIVTKADGLLIKIDGKNALFYNTAVKQLPEKASEIYSRSGFIHPLYSPSGKILTDDFPLGHLHQHGIMMAWSRTLFKGTAHDFWNQHSNSGNVKHISVERKESGRVTATLDFTLQHYSKKHGEVLSESWTVTIYPFSKYFLFDIESKQTNTTADTLFLSKYMYGGTAFRGSRQWNEDDSLHFKTKWSVLTNKGASLENASGTRAAYVSASGLIDDREAGLTVFGFPSNFNYPQPVRVHPIMPYWGFAPSATAGFQINPKETYSSKYRYYVHDGKANSEKLEQINNDILQPLIGLVRYK